MINHKTGANFCVIIKIKIIFVKLTMFLLENIAPTLAPTIVFDSGMKRHCCSIPDKDNPVLRRQDVITNTTFLLLENITIRADT